MKGIVDRFEDNIVVIEINGKTQDILRSFVAEDVQEGDVVEFQDGIWIRNPLATEKRSKKIKDLMDSLWDD